MKIYLCLIDDFTIFTASCLLNRCVFDSLCYLFLIKFLKRHLFSGFSASNYKSRVSIDPC